MERALGNVFIRDPDGPLQTGFVMEGHTHNFDHVTYFPMGTWEVWRLRLLVDKDGIPQKNDKGEDQWIEMDRVIKRPGGYLLIEAGCRHGFKLLEGPGLYHCIFAHRDPQSHEVVQDWNGWYEATS